MRHHPAWLAAGLLVFALLACNLSKNTNNSNSNSNIDSGAGKYLSEIHMAKDDDGKPGAATTTFSPGDRTIHCVTKLKDAKGGTQMKFSWWIVDADGTKNKLIKEIEYTTGTRENIVHGHLTLPQDWPKGKYKVDVYVNGELDRTVSYAVE